MSDAGMSRRSGKTAMGATTSSLKTTKSSKERAREAEFQKLVQQELHKISTFENAEPPAEDAIWEILAKKTAIEIDGKTAKCGQEFKLDK